MSDATEYRARLTGETEDAVYQQQHDYTGYPEIQADIVDVELQRRHPGLTVVEAHATDPAVADALAAANAISTIVPVAPTEHAQYLSALTGNAVWLKREDTQPYGSFKNHGPAFALLNLSAEERRRGVIAASAGNHAQNLAAVATRLGVRSTAVMPARTADVKVNATRRNGADVLLYGRDYTEAAVFSRLVARSTGATYVHAFDNPDVITGNSVIGLEAMLQQPDATYHFVPVGGGGLIAGYAQIVKAINPSAKVIGVQATGSEAMLRSVRRGNLESLPEVDTYSEGTAVREVGQLTLAAVNKYVDDFVVADRQAIAQAVLDTHHETGVFMEQAGALSVAGLQQYAYSRRIRGETMVAVTSGRNISAQNIAELGAVAAGRQRVA